MSRSAGFIGARGWRRCAQSLGVAALISVAVWAVLRVAVPAWIAAELRDAVRERGFPHADFRLAGGSLDHLELAEVDLGDGAGLTADRVRIEFGFDLLWRRRADLVIFEGASADPQALEAAWSKRPRRASASRGPRLPFDLAHIARSELSIRGRVLPVEGTLRWLPRGAFAALRSELVDSELGAVTLEAIGGLWGPDDRRGAAAALTARGPAAGDRGDLALRYQRRDDAPRRWSAEGALRWARLAGPHGIAARDVRGTLALDVRGAAVHAAKLELRAAATSVGERPVGALALRAGRAGEELPWSLSLRDAATTLDARGTLPRALPAIATASVPIAVDAAGALPAELRARLAAAELTVADGARFALRGRGEGSLADGGPRLEIGELRLTAAAASARAGDAGRSAGDLELVVTGHGTVADGASNGAFTATARAGRLRLGPHAARDVELVLTGRGDAEPGRQRVAVERAELRAASLSSALADQRLRTGAIALHATGPGEVAATLERADGAASLHLAAEVASAAPVRLRGPLRGVLRSLRVALEGTPGALRGSTELRLDQLRVPRHRLALTSFRVRAPIACAPRCQTRSDGHLAVAGVALRGRPIGDARGAFRWRRRALTADLDARVGSAALRLRARLRPGAPAHLAVTMPPTRLRPGGRVAGLLHALTGVRASGRAAVDASLELGREGPRGAASLSLRGGTLRRGDLRLDGVDADVDVTELWPLTTARPASLQWKSGAVADRAFGGGRVVARADGRGTLAIDRARVAWFGGTLRATDAEASLERRTLDVTVEADGLRLSRLLPLVSRGKSRGRGLVDGAVTIAAAWGDRPSLRVVRGHLAGRGRGRIALRDRGALERYARRALAPGHTGLIAERITAALSDFEFSELRLVAPSSGPIRARVRGRGAVVPQELDLSINLRGVRPVATRAWDLWLAHRRPSTGSPRT